MLIVILLIFLSKDTQSCQISNCETCSNLNAAICINCNQGYTRDKGYGCVLDLQLLLTQKPIIENCVLYSVSSECLSCSENYELINSRCSPICSKNCSCFDPGECLEKMTDSATNCYDYNCLSCSSYNVCNTCKSGYYVLSGACSYCGYGCKTCVNSGYCTICYSGYYLDSGECSNCDYSCSQCTSDDQCQSCDSGYSLHNGYCELDDVGTALAVITIVFIVIACVVFL
jgi:hypothetical protein